MISRQQLLSQLTAMVERKEIRNVDIARALKLPDSRVPALLRGERRIYFDEATRLVEAFGLEQDAEPLPLPVLRLLVRYLADHFRVRPDEETVEELAKDLRAFSAFAADQRVRHSVDAAEGFFRGLGLRRQEAGEDQPETDPHHAR